jgi:hypothetical protein
LELALSWLYPGAARLLNLGGRRWQERTHGSTALIATWPPRMESGESKDA